MNQLSGFPFACASLCWRISALSCQQSYIQKAITPALLSQVGRQGVSGGIAPAWGDWDSRADLAAGHSPCDLQSRQFLTRHGMESSVVPDVKANWKKTQKKCQARAGADVCFSRVLRGRGSWSASCCSPRGLTRRTSCLFAAAWHTQSFLTRPVSAGTMSPGVVTHVLCLVEEGISLSLRPRPPVSPSIYAV